MASKRRALEPRRLHATSERHQSGGQDPARVAGRPRCHDCSGTARPELSETPSFLHCSQSTPGSCFGPRSLHQEQHAIGRRAECRAGCAVKHWVHGPEAQPATGECARRAGKAQRKRKSAAARADLAAAKTHAKALPGIAAHPRLAQQFSAEIYFATWTHESRRSGAARETLESRARRDRSSPGQMPPSHDRLRTAPAIEHLQSAAAAQAGSAADP